MSIGSDDPTTGRARQGPRPEVADRGTNEGGAASSTSDLIDVDARLDAAVDGVRRRACGLAVALTVDGTTSVVLDEGRYLLTDHALFEIGSVTKTMTALVLATAVADGEVALGTTVGEVLGTAAHCVAPVTLLQLATHTAGLPRLAPNHRLDGDDPEDPYARFDEGASWPLSPRWRRPTNRPSTRTSVFRFWAMPWSGHSPRHWPSCFRPGSSARSE